MNTLIDRLKNKAHAEGLVGQAKDEVFDLVAVEQCQQCCLLGNGGTAKVK